MASMLVAGMAISARPGGSALDDQPLDRAPEPELEPTSEKPTNLPGESNRAFAARIKAVSQ